MVGGETCAEAEARNAYDTGAELGRRGHLLVCGGRGGVMREACRGAKSEGGTTIGILPGGERSEMNAFVDIPIVTGMGSARNAIVVRSADGVIAIGGRYGTLSEVAFALVWGKPVVSLGSWALQSPDGSPVPLIACETAADAVDAIEAACRG